MAQIRCSGCGKALGDRDGVRLVPDVGNLCDACFEQQRQGNTMLAVLTVAGCIIIVLVLVVVLVLAVS